jgi:transcription initiation factor TFIID subunit TAF12
LKFSIKLLKLILGEVAEEKARAERQKEGNVANDSSKKARSDFTGSALELAKFVFGADENDGQQQQQQQQQQQRQQQQQQQQQQDGNVVRDGTVTVTIDHPPIMTSSLQN